MGSLRVIGNNCKIQLEKNNIDKPTFAEKIGYDEYDVEKLLDGRLFVSEDDLRDIATELKISVSELCTDCGNQVYMNSGFIHCMGPFKHAENQEEILDIFDMYCDLQEVLDK